MDRNRDNSHERRATAAANQGSLSSHRSQYRREQPLLVRQFFDNHWTNSIRPPRHPLPQIHQSNDSSPPVHHHHHHQHHHPSVNNRGIPTTVPIQNRNRPTGGDRLSEVANYRQYEHHIRGCYYDQNNSEIINEDNRNGVPVHPRHHYDRPENNSNNNRRTRRVPSGVHHNPHAPQFQNSSVQQQDRRNVPRIQSSSPTQRNHVFPSSTSVEIVDEQLVIRLVFPLPANINSSRRVGHQEPPLPESLLTESFLIAEQTNHVSTEGISEDSIVRHLKTRTFVGKPTSEYQMCTICQDSIEENNRIGTLECGHEYHAHCITEWLKVNNQCPLCKRTGLTTSMEREQID